MTLRDRVHVPTVWMTGWQAAVRRVSEMMTQKASSGRASDAVRIDLNELVRADPSLLKPLAIPVITPALLDQAVEGLEQKNVLRFLGCANGNEYWLDLLAANVPLLKELDLYERGLLDALIASRTNNYVHRDKIPLLIEHADRAQLLAAGSETHSRTASAVRLMSSRTSRKPDLLVSDSVQPSEEGKDRSDRIINRFVLRLCSIDTLLRLRPQIRPLDLALDIADPGKKRRSAPESIEDRVDR